MATICKQCGGRVSDVGDTGCPHIGARDKEKRTLEYRPHTTFEAFCQTYNITPEERNALIEYLKVLRNGQLDRLKAEIQEKHPHLLEEPKFGSEAKGD